MSVIIWIIGIMFTIGILDFDWDAMSFKEKFLLNLLLILAWPFVLGVAIKKTLEDLHD